jgi:hypothetical protein
MKNPLKSLENCIEIPQISLGNPWIPSQKPLKTLRKTL